LARASSDQASRATRHSAASGGAHRKGRRRQRNHVSFDAHPQGQISILQSEPRVDRGSDLEIPAGVQLVELRILGSDFDSSRTSDWADSKNRDLTPRTYTGGHEIAGRWSGGGVRTRKWDGHGTRPPTLRGGDQGSRSPATRPIRISRSCGSLPTRRTAARRPPLTAVRRTVHRNAERKGQGGVL
jgi:hypothetical protein